MATEDPDEVIRLATAPNPAIAHIWEQALKAAGIRSKVVGDYLDAGLGDISGLQPELWVRRKDVAQAEEVLRDDLQGKPPVDEKTLAEQAEAAVAEEAEGAE